jgi:NTP pyrophosphatase (non-canonical NTP hydrolase)
MNIQKLIEKVISWGDARKITGENPKGTPVAQFGKLLEEVEETAEAMSMEIYENSCGVLVTNHLNQPTNPKEIKDGIGDCTVVLILLARMHGWTLEECLEHAYKEIENRTGEWIGGTYVKDK